jgi:hypothetical protein
MWDYQIIKEKFYRLAQDAENNVRKDKLKAPKAPPVYESFHDISLAKRDVYMLLATSHYSNKQDFIDALKQHLESSVKNSNAFDEKRYSDARGNYIRDLIAEYQ